MVCHWREPLPVWRAHGERIPSLAADAGEAALLREVADAYHGTLRQSPEALNYLTQRALVHGELVDTFRLGYGVNLGIPNSVGAGINVSADYLNTKSVSPGQTNNFAGGYAGGGSALYGGLGGGIMVSPGNGTATVIGFGAGTNVGKTDNPVSVGWGFSNDQGKTGIRW